MCIFCIQLELCSYLQCIAYVFVQIQGKVLAPSKVSRNFNGVNFHKSMVTSKLFVLGTTYNYNNIYYPGQMSMVVYSKLDAFLSKMGLNPNFCFCAKIVMIFRQITVKLNFTNFTWNHVLKQMRQCHTQCAQCGKVLQNAITLKNFREINSLVTSLVKTVIWRKNVDFPVKIVIVFLMAFPHCGVEITGILSHTFLSKNSWK